jgi:hypothetical protein
VLGFGKRERDGEARADRIVIIPSESMTRGKLRSFRKEKATDRNLKLDRWLLMPWLGGGGFLVVDRTGAGHDRRTM